MYPHVFSSALDKGNLYNFLHPPLFCGIDEKWYWGGPCDLKWLEKEHMGEGGDFLVGENTPKDTMLIKKESFYI